MALGTMIPWTNVDEPSMTTAVFHDLPFCMDERERAIDDYFTTCRSVPVDGHSRRPLLFSLCLGNPVERPHTRSI
eukprot:609181-Prymnesium_polylepis.2